MSFKTGGVAGLVGIESGVVSGLSNPNDSGVATPVETKPWEAITRSLSRYIRQLGRAPTFHDWFDPIEVGVRRSVRSFIEGMIEAELETALSRPALRRPAKTQVGADSVRQALSATGTAAGATLMGTFGRVRSEFARPVDDR